MRPSGSVSDVVFTCEDSSPVGFSSAGTWRFTLPPVGLSRFVVPGVTVRVGSNGTWSQPVAPVGVVSVAVADGPGLRLEGERRGVGRPADGRGRDERVGRSAGGVVGGHAPEGEARSHDRRRAGEVADVVRRAVVGGVADAALDVDARGRGAEREREDRHLAGLGLHVEDRHGDRHGHRRGDVDQREDRGRADLRAGAAGRDDRCRRRALRQRLGVREDARRDVDMDVLQDAAGEAAVGKAADGLDGERGDAERRVSGRLGEQRRSVGLQRRRAEALHPEVRPRRRRDERGQDACCEGHPDDRESCVPTAPLQHHGGALVPFRESPMYQWQGRAV